MPLADQAWESFGIATSCLASPSQLGWMGADLPGLPAGLFIPSLPAQLLLLTACQLSRATSVLPMQAYLLLALLLVASLSWICCRWLGYRESSTLLVTALICTAPASFSRIGHLQLAPLISVVPALLTCLLLDRAMSRPRPWPRLLGVGALAALLTFPSQDYYVAFSVLILAAAYWLLLLLRSAASLEAGPLLKPAGGGACLLAGFLLVVVLAYLPKILAAGADGLPAAWVAPRLAAEQFRYGLLPLTWMIPSPWVASMQAALQHAWVDTSSESYFWSTGSLLIPVAWMCAIRRLAQAPLKDKPFSDKPLSDTPRQRRLVDRDRRVLAVLLLLVSAIGLLCMTMGGLGTLFAVLVSPVLRSLNRFSVFVYGAAVLYMAAEFDIWLQRRDQHA